MAYTREQIQSIFRSSFNQTEWTNMIINFFKAREVYRVNNPLDINPEEGRGSLLGYLDTQDGYRIGFFYLKLNRSIDRRKVGLRQMITQYIKIDSDAGIGVFDDGSHWRLSFITDLNGEKTAPKRYTFVFGDSENQYRTAVDRFMDLQKNGISFKNIKEAFSVEALTKQFYNDLFDWYTWALDPTTGVYIPENKSMTDDEKKKAPATRMIRLITRMMFVWFIKQKGLIPENLFDEEEVSLWLKEFDPLSPTSGNYYQAIIQNLFFATLNRPIKTPIYDKDGNKIGEERRAFAKLKGKHDVKSLYRYEDLFKINEDKILSIFEFIPFINGGLFECLDKDKTQDGKEAYWEDGFTRNDTYDTKNRRYVNRALIPNKLFFSDSEKNGGPDGLITIFKRYNFTVEENSPSEQQVALDPELLGKVFENLLGVYNPETCKTARKSSGSFYTPRTIVNYMVDCTLKEYLGNTSEVMSIFGDDFEYDESKKEQYDSIINKLQTIKVLDPACGSGAFPMGMLNRIIEIMEKLKAPGNKYDLKLQIMENCIYGGDIQSIAAQITKLRFFISLVCDCKRTDNPDENYGIPDLPNLETHFVTADSLGSLEKPESYNLFETDVLALKEELKKVRHEHFMAKTVYQKTKLRNRDKQLRDELAEMLASDSVIASRDAQQMVAWNPYDQNAKADFFEPEWMFGINDGFDIVIGNPPYTQVGKGIYSKKAFPYSEGKDQGKQNLYKMFVELSYNLAKKNTGIACMIVQSSLMCDLSSKHTRELLLKNTQLKFVIEFPKTAPTPEGQVFESVCQGTCIYLFRRQRPTGEQFVISVNNDCTTLDKMNIEYMTQNSLIQFYPEDFAIPLLREGEFSILSKIKNNSTLKKYLAESSQGDLNLTSEKKYFSENYSGALLLRGKHTGRYVINYNAVEEFIQPGYKDNVIDLNHRRHYILCHQITGTTDKRRMIVSITNPEESFIVGNSLNKFRLKDDTLTLYITGLLNSKLLDWVFRKTSSNNHVNCYELEQLPIVIPCNIKKLSDKYDQIANSKDDFDIIERKADYMVYRLYNLSYEEACLVDGNLEISKQEYQNINVD